MNLESFRAVILLAGWPALFMIGFYILHRFVREAKKEKSPYFKITIISSTSAFLISILLGVVSTILVFVSIESVFIVLVVLIIWLLIQIILLVFESRVSSENKLYLRGQLKEKDLSLEKIRQSLSEDLNIKNEDLLIARKKLQDQQKALINLLEDLSEEKKIKEVQSQSMLENIGEGIIITNDAGNITYVNPVFEKMFGYTFEELKNKTLADTLTAFTLQGKKISKNELTDAAMITAKNQEVKLKLVSKAKSQISVIVNAAPVKVDKEFKGVIRVIHDISDDVKLKQQRDDFFSIASHELRTPLTVISGNLDIILQGYGKSKLSKDDKELIEDSVASSDRLINMINDFLNVSRLDQGRLKYKLVKKDVNPLVKSVVSGLEALASDKNLTLQYKLPKLPSILDVDESLLRQIVINLIGNAIKFTRSGDISVNVKTVKGQFNLRVKDTGVGIKKSDQSILFQRFQQVSGTALSRQANGTGLGLYVSREFARVMGGDLVLEKSEFEKGSTFLLSLPLAKTAKKS